MISGIIVTLDIVVYSGLVPALAGVSHVAIQFPTYEKIKCYLARKGNRLITHFIPPCKLSRKKARIELIALSQITQRWINLAHVMLRLPHLSPRYLLPR